MKVLRIETLMKKAGLLIKYLSESGWWKQMIFKRHVGIFGVLRIKLLVIFLLEVGWNRDWKIVPM